MKDFNFTLDNTFEREGEKNTWKQMCHEFFVSHKPYAIFRLLSSVYWTMDSQERFVEHWEAP